MAIETGLTLQVSVIHSHLLLLFCGMYFYCLFGKEQIFLLKYRHVNAVLIGMYSKMLMFSVYKKITKF